MSVSEYLPTGFCYWSSSGSDLIGLGKQATQKVVIARRRMKRLQNSGLIDIKSREWEELRNCVSGAIKARRRREYDRAMDYAELALYRINRVQRSA